jgi:hypothetical protein
VKLDRPAALDVALVDSRGPRTLHFPADDVHDVPLLGFRPHDDVDVTVTASDDVGESEPVTLTFTSGELPDRFPDVDVLALDPDRVEPGYTLFPVHLVTDGRELVRAVALDAWGEPVWVWRTSLQLVDLRLEGGNLLALAEGLAWELTPLGEPTREWGDSKADDPRPDRYFQLDAPALNHELFPRANGDYLTLSVVTRAEPAYPCDYAAPGVLCGAALLEDPHVVAFDPEGNVVSDWSLADRLAPTRIGFDSLDVDLGRYDWAHANAVIEMPDGGVLVSLRHQDCLVALDDDGDVRWILGNHDGWPASFAPALLDPVGADFTWPYHQHGPAFAPDGTLWVFDNGNYGGTPYTGASDHDPVSRAVGYRVDEAAGTVAQVAELRGTSTGELYSSIMGDVRPLPSTGDVFADFGDVRKEAGIDDRDLGFGGQSSRFVEWTPDGEVVSDVRIRSDVVEELGGWRAYRAIHVASLYADGVEQP